MRPTSEQQQQVPISKINSSASNRVTKDSSSTTFEESAEGKRRRIRKSYSCGNCQQRKSRCDRSFPCGQCLVRGVQDTCRPSTTSPSNDKHDDLMNNLGKEYHKQDQYVKSRSKAKAPAESLSSVEGGRSFDSTSSDDSDIAINNSQVSFDKLHKIMKSLQKQLSKADHKTSKIKFGNKTTKSGESIRPQHIRRSSWNTGTDSTMEMYVTIESKIRALEYKLDMILNRLTQFDHHQPFQDENVRPVLLRDDSSSSAVMQASSSSQAQDLHLDLTMTEWLQQVGWPSQMDTEDVRYQNANSM